jgi:D-3-phosphoglycerate dehydrogenase
MKILVAASLDPAGLTLLKGVADAEVVEVPDCSDRQLSKMIRGADVLIVEADTAISRETLARGRQLQLIGLLGAGRPRFDLDAATAQGILVMNAPESVSVSIAEHTLGLLLALARRLPESDAGVKRGAWDHEKLRGMEVRDKVLGVIGFGVVGSLVAERAIALKMKVIVYDPHLSADTVACQGCRQVELSELFRESDAVTVHAPLNAETRGLIGRDSLSRVKRGVLIINCSAAEIVDESALQDALMRGQVGGAALDLHGQPPVSGQALYLSNRVICTPDLAAHTRESVAGGSLEMAKQIVDYLARGSVIHALNLPGAEEAATEEAARWLGLCEAMGCFLIQLHPYGVQEVRVEVAGEGELPETAALSRSVLTGILAPILGDRVNRINAQAIAGQRGIRLKEGRLSTAVNYRNVITVRVETDRGEGSVSGTLFDNRTPRIVEVDGFEVEVVPDGDLVVVFNRDRPGVIADVAETLGQHGINIGQMYNGRDTTGGTAITALRVDSPVTDDILKRVREFPNILTARRVNLTRILHESIYYEAG